MSVETAEEDSNRKPNKKKLPFRCPKCKHVESAYVDENSVIDFPVRKGIKVEPGDEIRILCYKCEHKYEIIFH